MNHPHRRLRHWHATANLAWHLLKHVLRRAFTLGDRHIDQARRFHENYAADGIYALTSAERAVQAATERCTACGLCDAVCPELRRPGVPFFAGPAAAVLQHSALLPSLPRVIDDLAACTLCGDCDRICPPRIPIATLIANCRAQAERG